MGFMLCTAGIISGNFMFAYYEGVGYTAAIERSYFQALAVLVIFIAGARFPAKAK